MWGRMASKSVSKYHQVPGLSRVISRGAAMGAGMRRDAREIFRRAVEDSAPEKLLSAQLHRRKETLEGPGFRIQPKRGERITVFAYGKASFRMASGLRKMLPRRDVEGIVVIPAGVRGEIAGLDCLRA